MQVTPLKENMSKIKATMTATSKRARPPKYVIFEIKIANEGNTILNTVGAFDQISLYAKYVSDSICGKVERNNVEWSDIGSLKPGDEVIIALTVFIDDKPSNGFWTNGVRVWGTSAEGERVEDACVAEVKYYVRKTHVRKTRGNPKEKRGTWGYDGNPRMTGLHTEGVLSRYVP